MTFLFSLFAGVPFFTSLRKCGFHLYTFRVGGGMVNLGIVGVNRAISFPSSSGIR